MLLRLVDKAFSPPEAGKMLLRLVDKVFSPPEAGILLYLRYIDNIVTNEKNLKFAKNRMENEGRHKVCPYGWMRPIKQPIPL